MKILGFSSDVKMASAALIEDGKIIAAAVEERFTRIKQDRSFPKNAIQFCLNKAGCKIEDITYLALGWNPGEHIKRYNPRFSSTVRWRAEYLYNIPNNLIQFYEKPHIDLIEQNLKIGNTTCKIIFVDHHLTHASNSFFLSPFKEAAIITADGRGGDHSITYYYGSKNKIKRIKEVAFPNSLGLFYTVFTEFLGFNPDSDEWKVMALAAYSKGKNPYYNKVKKIIKFFPKNGQIELDLSYFRYFLHDQLTFFTEKFIEEFGQPRKADDKLTKRHYQISEALQRVTEEILTECLNYLQKITGSKNIVVSGGVFMNAVFNGKILSKTRFDNLFISSCPDDSGSSIGAALHVYHTKVKDGKREIQVHNSYGPEFTNEEIKTVLDKYKVKYQQVKNIEKFTAAKIADGKLIGWFQGRMEFGQRALGNRSILCDPRDAAMKDRVNKAVKYRESFRPFAPSILEEDRNEYFDMDKDALVPFMEKVYMIKKDKQKIIPAVTHKDGTGRVQTVNRNTNPKYHSVISEFKKITGVPVIFNTSFNLNGEPIVCSPKDAIRTFFSCGLDILILGNYVVEK